MHRLSHLSTVRDNPRGHPNPDMKRCPDCGRNYPDETLSFCLDDGATLVYESGGREADKTAILDLPPSEAPTHQQEAAKVTTGLTSDDSKRKLIFAAAVVILTLAAGFAA